MALSYVQLGQAIQDYTNNFETTFTANIPVFIRQAENRITRAVLLPNFKNNQLGTTIAGNRFLTLPVGFLSPLSLVLIDLSGNYMPLRPKETAFIYELYPSVTSQAQPKYYALYSDTTAILGPTPDQNYGVELEYFYQPPSIVDVGTSWLGTNAEACLLFACLVDAYTFMKGDKELLDQYDKKYQEALVDLKKLAQMTDAMDDYIADPTKMKPT